MACTSHCAYFVFISALTSFLKSAITALSTMTPLEEKLAQLERLRLERARQEEERKVRERLEVEQRAREQELEIELEVLRLEEEEEQKRREEMEKKRKERWRNGQRKFHGERWSGRGRCKRSTGRVGRQGTWQREAPRRWRSPRAGTARSGSRSASGRGEWPLIVFLSLFY